MGGRVGLKGTDGVAGQALERGAQPIASHRAREMLDALQLQLRAQAGRIAIEWLSCGGKMGTDVLAEAGFTRTEVVLEPKAASDADDTKNAVAAFLEKRVDLVLFCGGDGTARDIASVAGQRVPMLGIPSGVKMYSGVFGTTPGRTADILLRFLKGELRAIEVEVLDLDETKYRSGEWAIRQFQLVLTPFEPTYTQAAKQVVSEVPDAQAKSEIAAYMAEQIAESPGTLFILGPGSTVEAVAARLVLPRRCSASMPSSMASLRAGHERAGHPRSARSPSTVQARAQPYRSAGFRLGPRQPAAEPRRLCGVSASAI